MTDSKQNEDDTRRDAVMEELRAARERLAAQRNYDVRALAEEAKDRERASNRTVVKSTPRRPAAAATTEESRDGTLDPRTLDEIVRRVVEVAQPERIVLFGSAARGDMTRHGDVDLLIVKDGADALELMSRIYRRLRGAGVPVDALVVSADDVARYRDSHALIVKPALREGRTVYESARARGAGEAQ